MKHLSYLALSFMLAGAVPAVHAAEKAEPKKEEESPEKKELEKLSLENSLQKQKAAQKLQPLENDKDELKLLNDIRNEKEKAASFDDDVQYKKLSTEQSLYKMGVQNRLRELMTEKEELGLHNSLVLERLKKTLAALEAEQYKLDMENRLEDAKHKKELAVLKRDYELLKVRNDMQQEKLKETELLYQAERSQIDLELKRLSLRSGQVKFEQEQRQDEIARLKADISMRSGKEEWKQEANKEPLYDEKPFVKGRLAISDRRIPLNGPIFRGVADFVTERIHYFNNEDPQKPIFLVIDSSPGGSVMEGYRIIKAIEASKAPIHVIVKSFAASMAAAITTLADESYAYPNAVLLHHEMSTLTWGNMTQLKEQLELAKEWERRLMLPIAKKIGMPMEDFRKEMYKHNSDGDWEEFADTAQKYKWVKNIVHEIRETGFIKRPGVEPKSKSPFMLEEQTDPQGKRYVTLPRLEPFDMYYIHNPDRYYR